MKKRIFMSLTMVFLVAALVGGATFALFTDSSTNANNTFAAGTVDVTVGSQEYEISLGNIAPGDVIEGSFEVTNSGSLDQWYRVRAVGTGDLFGGSTPAKAEIEAPHSNWTRLDANADAVTVDYTITLPKEADNSYQGDKGELTFIVDAQQYDNNVNGEGDAPSADDLDSPYPTN